MKYGVTQRNYTIQEETEGKSRTNFLLLIHNVSKNLSDMDRLIDYVSSEQFMLLLTYPRHSSLLLPYLNFNSVSLSGYSSF